MGKFSVGDATMKDKAPGLFPIANQCLSLGHGHWVKLSPKSYCYRRFGLLYALEANKL